MRNIGDVINKMLQVIPLSEQAFHHDLNSIMRSIKYAAPENMPMWWQELNLVINDHLPHANNCKPWQTQVGIILMDKE